VASAAEIAELERLADEAWPAAVVEEHDGWLLRWAEGPWNRTNSVAAVAPGRAPLAAKIDHAERWYSERDRPANFKLTEASQPPELADLLRRRGYAEGFTVSVQTRPAATTAGRAEIRIDRRPTPEWLAAKRRIAGGTGERARHLPELLGRIAHPIAFASQISSGAVVGVGLGVVTSRHVGVFDLAVDTEQRRRGVATRLIRALAGWGVSQGAETAYLQVETTNAAALDLYRRLGFSEAYRYWYRVVGDR
jgi:ribosomal protein S18 acetylase RimI-like enzyme